jgi:DNA-binding winged helix-turn-helix (wHTH) protein
MSTLRFGDFELNRAAYALRRSGSPVKLEKMPMEVLILLVEHHGGLVPRGQIEALWGPDVFVEHDAAINTAVRKIRQALADDADHPRFVETVIGKGYRFMAPVEHLAEARDAATVRCRVTRGRQEFALDAGENLLGRDPDTQVYVDHASVSRRHARISIADRATIEDLGSRNGTYLDGHRLDAPAQLQSGAVIGLGPITLTFLILPEPASTKDSTTDR